jgi:hypothetical protein
MCKCVYTYVYVYAYTRIHMHVCMFVLVWHVCRYEYRTQSIVVWTLACLPQSSTIHTLSYVFVLQPSASNLYITHTLLHLPRSRVLPHGVGASAMAYLQRLHTPESVCAHKRLEGKYTSRQRYQNHQTASTAAPENSVCANMLVTSSVAAVISFSYSLCYQWWTHHAGSCAVRAKRAHRGQ